MSVTVNFEREILEEAAASPVAAIMRVSLEIDRELRKLLAVTGMLGRYSGEMPDAIDLLGQKEQQAAQMPKELKDTLVQFWTLRNQVVHGQSVSEHLALRALDYGLRILRLLKSIPRHSFVVYKAGIPLYSDPEGRQQRDDVKGVIVETVSAEGERLSKRIFPTTKAYCPGESLSWEWNHSSSRKWGETWYRDPDTMEIKPAWSDSLEFVGRNLDEI